MFGLFSFKRLVIQIWEMNPNTLKPYLVFRNCRNWTPFTKQDGGDRSFAAYLGLWWRKVSFLHPSEQQHQSYRLKDEEPIDKENFMCSGFLWSWLCKRNGAPYSCTACKYFRTGSFFILLVQFPVMITRYNTFKSLYISTSSISYRCKL